MSQIVRSAIDAALQKFWPPALIPTLHERPWGVSSGNRHCVSTLYLPGV